MLDRTRHTADPLPSASDAEFELQSAKRAIVSQPPHFFQLIGILRRRSRLILMITAFGTILAGITGLLIKPKYTATAQIVVEPPAAALLSPETVQQVIDTHVTMLTSASHVQRVVDSLRKETEFRGPVPETRPVTKAGASAPADDVQSRSPAAAPASVKAITPDAAPLSLNELDRRLNVWIHALVRKRGDGTGLTFEDVDRRLKVMQERRSRVITISFEWTNPEKAAAIANRIAGLYVQSHIEQQRAYSSREMARLDERIAAVRSDLERNSAALRDVIQQRLGASRSAGAGEQDAAADTRELERRAAASGQLYTNLLQRQKEAREQQELIRPEANILSLASPPPRPSSPNPILFMFPALIVALICGSFLAILLERLDRGVRCEREIGELFGISCVGLIPQIAGSRLSRLSDDLLTDPFSAYAEAIRSATATLQLAEGGDSARVVLITSSIPGEGKTVLARSLATFVGSLGRRVLLVDLDFRRGSPPDGFDEADEKTITYRPLQNRSPAELIRHMAEGWYDYLPVPGHRDDPLTLFAGQIPGLIGQLRERYDCLIVDGPPVLGAAEARLLPSIVDKLVLVVKWGSTRREMVANALSLVRDCGGLDRDGGAPPVAILTQVDLRRHARYRYGDVGEFLAENGKRRSRAIAPRGLLAAAAALASAHESRLATLSTLLQSSRRRK